MTSQQRLMVIVFLAVVGCDPALTSLEDAGAIGADAGVERDGSTFADAGLVSSDGDDDSDGLRNDEELALGTNPRQADTDGDGTSDGVEVVAGTDPLDPASRIPETDFYIVLPFEAAAVTRSMSFRARLGRGDVMFLVDTTGSMNEPIANVRASLSRVIVPRIAEVFADAWMGVADFQDFPVAPYGGDEDYPFRLRQAPTSDVSAVQGALDALTLGDGGDVPEALLEGIYGVATTPGFRPDATSIIVAITDGQAHNAPGSLPYWDGLVTARSYAETLSVMRERGFSIVGVAVPTFGGNIARDDLEDLGRDSASLGADGEPIVLDAPSGGVSSSIVSGIAELVRSVAQDVTSRTIDDPSDEVDATRFIRAVRPLRAERAERFDESTFYGVAGGSEVTFEVSFMNDFVAPADEVRIFVAQIELHDPASTEVLDRRQVYVVVPRCDGGLI